MHATTNATRWIRYWNPDRFLCSYPLLFPIVLVYRFSFSIYRHCIISAFVVADVMALWVPPPPPPITYRITGRPARDAMDRV